MTPYIWDGDMIYGAYFLTNMPAASEQNSHFIEVCPPSAAIHLGSPLVIQLHTLAPATDVADRFFLIILSLSARSSVCFRSARDVVIREDSGMTLANRRRMETKKAASSRQTLPAFILNHWPFPAGYTEAAR